jgi:hypothetical protein
VGYGGLGGFGLLSLLSIVTGGALWMRHRRLGRAVSCALLLLLLSAVGLGVSGCSGLQPSLNSSYTAPGSYTYTVTATDGFLVHSTTYSLTVTAK